MNGNNILLDTNACLYILSDNKKAVILNQKNVFISFVTELELLSYSLLNDNEIIIIKNFINKVEIIDVNQDIKTITINLRKKYKLKLPDAIIIATAYCLDFTLITNDKKLLKIIEIKTQNLKI